MNNVARMNGSYRTCESVMSHACMGHVAHMSCRTHVAHMTASCLLPCVCVCVYVCVCMCGCCSHSDVWHESFRCVTWHIHIYYMTHSVKELIQRCDLSNLDVWLDSFFKSSTCHDCVRVALLYEAYLVLMNGSGHTHAGVISQIWMSHVALTNESCCTYEWVTSHIRMSRVAHKNESCRTHE